MTTVTVPSESGVLGLSLRSDYDMNRLVIGNIAKTSPIVESGVFTGANVQIGSLLWSVDGHVLAASDADIVSEHVLAAKEAGRPITLDFMPMLAS